MHVHLIGLINGVVKLQQPLQGIVDEMTDTGVLRSCTGKLSILVKTLAK